MEAILLKSATVIMYKPNKVSKKISKVLGIHSVLQDSPSSDEIKSSPLSAPQQHNSYAYDLFSVKGKFKPIVLTVSVNMAVLHIELDTGLPCLYL